MTHPGNQVTYPRVLAVGETAFTVEFGECVAVDLTHQVHALDTHLSNKPVPGILETVPTYRSLLVIFDPQHVEANALGQHLLQLARNATDPGREIAGHLVEIPVHYGGEAGPDLTSIADHCHLTPEEVIRNHAGVVYQVAMLGFAPGFTYLLGLPSQLATPRLPTPRVHVPPGSIGIAGNQTGIYALGSPGGWRIIGQTDARLFDPARENPFLISAGDRVRFVPTRIPT